MNGIFKKEDFFKNSWIIFAAWAKQTSPLLEIIGNWQEFLSKRDLDKETKKILRHERTERPLGSEGFISELKKTFCCPLQYKKPGPKGK